MPAKMNMIGKKYGRLTVLEQRGIDQRGEYLWLCRCDCGNMVVRKGHDIRTGRTKSCGCIHQESITKHGMSDTRLYSIWHAMNQRCFNANNSRYANYGGRNITVCDDWRDSFETFRDWAMANGYRDDLTIDRIDVNGSYSPGNCQWITNKEQQNNRRNNRMIEFNGEKKSLQQWAEKLNINNRALRKRIRSGWTKERALTEPVIKQAERRSKQ